MIFSVLDLWLIHL